VKGGFLIPPLPTSKLSVDKDSKARSPLGRSRQRKGDGAFGFASVLSLQAADQENRSLSHSKKRALPNPDLESLRKDGQRVLASLPMIANVKRQKEPRANSFGKVEKGKEPSALFPSSHKPTITSTTVRRNALVEFAQNSCVGATKCNSAEPKQPMRYVPLPRMLTVQTIRQDSPTASRTANTEVSPNRRRTETRTFELPAKAKESAVPSEDPTKAFECEVLGSCRADVLSLTPPTSNRRRDSIGKIDIQQESDISYADSESQENRSSRVGLLSLTPPAPTRKNDAFIHRHFSSKREHHLSDGSSERGETTPSEDSTACQIRICKPSPRQAPLSDQSEDRGGPEMAASAGRGSLNRVSARKLARARENGNDTAQRSSLSSKSRLLGRAGLSGGAKRASTEKVAKIDSDSDDSVDDTKNFKPQEPSQSGAGSARENLKIAELARYSARGDELMKSSSSGWPGPNVAETNIVCRAVTSTVAPNTATTLKSMDLDYITNWEPKNGDHNADANFTKEQSMIANGVVGTDSLRKVTFDTTTVTTAGGSIDTNAEKRSKVATTNDELIEEVTLQRSSRTPSSSRNWRPLSSDHQGTSEGSKGRSGLNVRSCAGRNEITSTPSTMAPSISAGTNAPATTHPDFALLTLEKNMLTVNQVPYMKLEVIGKGGSCKVYKAMTKDRRIVAVKKVNLLDLDERAIEGYANEIALLERLRGNPNIIQMIDSEIDRNRKVILVVMEEGHSDLNAAFHDQQNTETFNSCFNDNEGSDNSRPLNINFIKWMWYQMLNAVHSIHEERIIHGDLKPANFLFVKGSLKLIDFGIAKAIQSEDTTNIYRENQIGTLSYMSPEAILGTSVAPGERKIKCGRVGYSQQCVYTFLWKSLTLSLRSLASAMQASDVWSLGCILYQMVYGRTPFGDMHLVQKLRAITDPSYQISFPHTVDEAALDVLQKCLRRDLTERPPIAGEGGLLKHRFVNGLGSNHTRNATCPE
jgi:Protein kinase domain